ncbi:MAG: hypothetical protein HYZ81_03430 [Nitrospinae bacterium]|nr:hypothetical protein [Nitrospinota bacterium]
MQVRWIVVGFVFTLMFAWGGGAFAYEIAPVSDAGVVTGKVLFKGEVPPPKIFKVEKNPEVCGEADRELIEVAVNDGALGEALVFLADVKQGKPFTDGQKEFVATEIVAKDCRFRPFEQPSFVSVVGKGKPIHFVNKDPMKHNPHTYEVRGKVRKTLANQELEGNSELNLVADLQKSRIMKLECDQHNFMQNFFYAIENPYYTLSKPDGTFAIDQVPPGTYTLVAWHPLLGLQEQQITVPANAKVTATVKFEEE